MKKIFGLLCALAAFLCLFSGCVRQTPAVSEPTQTVTWPSEPTETTVPPETVLTYPDPTLTQPAGESFLLSFAGDCTFGDNFDSETDYGTFCKVVKENYAYPLANVRDIFQNDDYSFVNLECALTESDPTEEEMEELKENLFRFRGPMAYTQILVEGGVEFASCANNHSKDYGLQGLYDTWKALDEAELDYASFGKSCVVTTDRGLTIGVFAVFFNTTQAAVESQVKYLRNQGAELIVMSVHWGDEGSYSPNEKQQSMGHMAIDAGVDIVYGHHSHTLQRIEPYNGGIIYYSLGNFSFGGNRNPKDSDTAIIQQEVLRYEDGTVVLGDLKVIPCSVSSAQTWNNYQPTPYAADDIACSRIYDKLQGSYEGDDVYVPYLEEEEE